MYFTILFALTCGVVWRICSAGRVEDLDTVVDRCVKVAAGISSQYLYRSMYAAQLHHCMKVEGNLLILPS
jgi:hypothetical protein